MLSGDERGFTLIEAMVAMMICSVGLIAMAELMAVTLRMQQLGRNSTSASRLAQDKIDELNTVGFCHASMLIGGSIAANNYVTDYNDIPAGATNYRRQWVVSAGPDASATLRQVTVRVTPELNDRRVATPFDLTTIIRTSLTAPCP
jgi:prepilin-type N-terminal cleavage/methylation domain-containing protein